jgi:glutamine synthetase
VTQEPLAEVGLHPSAESAIADALRDDDIELVRFLFVDHCGLIRGKAAATRALPGRMRSGIGLATSRQAASLLDAAQPVPGVRLMDEVRIVPDPATFTLLPHAPGSAAMLCDLVTPSGEPWGGCPRTFLRDAVDAAEDLDLRVAAAFEPEFTLALDRGPAAELDLLDNGLCLDNAAFDVANDYVVALCRALRSQGIAVEGYHPETSPGQHELTIGHGPALRAADHHVWQRAFTHGMARARGLRATFAPLPRPGLRGNGNHLHLSLWRPGAGNLFADPAGRAGLSDLALHFVGGVLAHLPALMALTCASVNSYERLEPGTWAGAFGCYGPDNRDAAIRVPSLLGEDAASANIELKVCDNTANPYLALGGLIHAGLDGVRRRLDPGEPMVDDPNALSDAELARRGVRPLPRSLGEALDALERDEYLLSVLGSPRRELYTAVKQADIRDMKDLGGDGMFALHATRY